MKTSTLMLAFLLIAGTQILTQPAFAQSSSSTDYAWRLDSVVCTMPTYYYEPDSTPYYPDLFTQYTYDDKSVTVVSCVRMLNHDTMTLIGPRKDVYTWAVDSGLYLKEGYNGDAQVASDQSLEHFTTHPVERKLYMKDSTHAVFDNNGRLVRQIRNFDFITFRLNTVYDEQSGIMTSIEWTPYSRKIHTDTDSTSVEQIYKYNTASGKWETNPESVVRNSYRNHILYMSIRESNYAYHENGEIASFLVDITDYTPMGVENAWVKAEIKRNTEGKNTYGRQTITIRDEPATRSVETSYTYDEQGNLVSTDNIERRIDRATNLCISEIHSERSGKVCLSKQEREWIIRTRPMMSIGGKTTLLTLENIYTNDSLKRHHYIRYDENYNIALEVDSFISAKGMWCYERKEYNNGEEIYSRSDREDPAYGGWTTFEEKDHRSPEYNLDILINIQGWSVNGGAYHYDTIRTTKRYYANGFDRMEKREKLLTNTFTWKLLNYSREETTFSSDGTPVSTIEYGTKDQEGQNWYENYLYTFTYDETIGMYQRIKTAQMVDNGDGTRSWQNLDKPIPDWYYRIGIGSRGMVNEYYYDIQEDIEGHQQHLYFYQYVDSTATWDLTYHNIITYFPEPDCKKEASRYFWRKENSSMVVPGNRTEGLELFTDTFDIFDEFGTFTEQHAYHWEGSTTLVCDTIFHNRPTYDTNGKLTECIEWTRDLSGDHPVTKYRYFYRPDGTQYGCAAKANYSYGKWASWSMTDEAGDVIYDEQGRIAEEIYYTLVKPLSQELAIVPLTRYLYYYEGDNADWYLRETYHWEKQNSTWDFFRSSYRGEAAIPFVFLDETDNIVRYEKRNEAYSLTYGASLETEPVLSPAAFGIREEKQLLYTDWLAPETLKARILTVHHQSEDKYGLLNALQSQYMARYYYSPLGNNPGDEPVSPTEEQTIVEPSDSTVTFAWPGIADAVAYSIIIWADEQRTEKICTIHLNSEGVVLVIDFSHAPRRTPWNAAMFTATIEHLLPGTQYWYTIQAYDDADLLMESINGTFTTTITDTAINDTEFSDSLGNRNEPHKFIHDGQLRILRDGKTYTVQGQEVR